jgi:hypothetical protein
MLHVDPHWFDPTVARAGFRVLIDDRTHHGSGPLLQSIYLEPETFPAERAPSLVHVNPRTSGRVVRPLVPVLAHHQLEGGQSKYQLMLAKKSPIAAPMSPSTYASVGKSMVTVVVAEGQRRRPRFLRLRSKDYLERAGDPKMNPREKPRDRAGGLALTARADGINPAKCERPRRSSCSTARGGR